MPDLPNDVLNDLDDSDWVEINRIGEELTKDAKPDAQRSEEQQAEGQAPDDSTEEKETSQKESTTEPYRTLTFNSKDEEQEYFDSMFHEREERWKRKQEREKAETEAKAKRDALKENEQYKELSDAQASELEELRGRVSELEPLEETVSSYKAKAEESVKARMSNLNVPAWANELLEGKDPLEKQAFLDKYEGSFKVTERLEGSEEPDTSGSPEGDKEAREQFDRSVLSGF